MPREISNETQNEEQAEDILAQVGGWVLIGGKPSKANRMMLEYFMVYMADAPLADNFVQAAPRLEGPEYTEIFRGMRIAFKNEPSPGFVLLIERPWALETPAQRQNAVEQILWEINHLTRG